MKQKEKNKLRKLSLDELLERFSLEDLEKIIPLKEILAKFRDEDDDLGGERGVLLSDEIKRYVQDFKLIVPFECDKLRAASYTLNVGDEYALGGKKEKLDTPDKTKITIPPFQVAIIKTKEIINMPRFLIGRWNIRVTNAYQGLIWAGGPQVDPGWVGHLYCPIYNLSEEDIELEKGAPFATIDFIRTTTFNKEKKDKMVIFPREERYKGMDDYNYGLKSALFTEAAQRLTKIEAKMNRIEWLIGIMFTSIAVLFAALSIIFTTQKELYIPFWITISVALSIIAISISLVWRVKLKIKEIREKWFTSVVIIYIVGSIIAFIILFIMVLW